MKDVLSATTSSAGMAHCVCVCVGGTAGRHQDFWDLFAYKKICHSPFFVIYLLIPPFCKFVASQKLTLAPFLYFFTCTMCSISDGLMPCATSRLVRFPNPIPDMLAERPACCLWISRARKDRCQAADRHCVEVVDGSVEVVDVSVEVWKL